MGKLVFMSCVYVLEDQRMCTVIDDANKQNKWNLLIVYPIYKNVIRLHTAVPQKLGDIGTDVALQHCSDLQSQLE